MNMARTKKELEPVAMDLPSVGMEVPARPEKAARKAPRTAQKDAIDTSAMDSTAEVMSPDDAAPVPLWDLNLEEIEGKVIESSGRAAVNKMLKKGWVVLHIYTLKYREGSTWRERPMAILGKPRKQQMG
jgi:hypothetical protein